jgi:hypothetical protein
MPGIRAWRRFKMLENINQNHQTFSSLKAYHSYSMEASTFSSKKTEEGQSTSFDKVSLKSESSLLVTYANDLTLKSSQDSRFDMLRQLVTNLLKEQGIETNFTVNKNEINIAEINPEQAQKLIEEDGYFGVEQTSERIFQFAIGVAGGDPSRLDAIKEGIEKGFQEAKEAFGNWLPDISYQTLDKVMEKLDKWATEVQ